MRTAGHHNQHAYGDSMASLRLTSWVAAVLAAASATSMVHAQNSLDDSGYRSAQNFRAFQQAGGGEEDRPTVIGRLEWLKARYGATRPADLSQRVAAEWAK